MGKGETLTTVVVNMAVCKMFRNSESKVLSCRLVEEILGQCSTVPVDLCAYLVDLKLLQLSDSTAFYSNLTEKIVKMCVESLKEDSLSIKILKLQLFWKKKYQPRDEIKKIHHERVFKNALPLMTEILDDSIIKTVDKDIIYKKIVIFVIMYAGLGSPSQQSILKEAQAALHSIFKPTEIENFLTLPKATKEQQLLEFARLITGIMLFNKDCKKGGEGMDDLPLILSEGVRATKDRFLNFKDQLDQKIEKLVKPLVFWYTKKDSEKLKDVAEHENTIFPFSDLEEEKLEELKTLLIYFRQVEFCLNDLIKDLEKSFLSVDELVDRLQSALLQIHNVVRYRVAVATVQVFPLFIQLSDIWVEMQEEVDILSEINNNFVDLSLTAKSILSTSWELELPEETAVPETDEIRKTSDFFPGVTVCSISSVPNQECLQYKGFCAWTLAHTEGVLVTGNITLGVLEFANRFYTFSSGEAAHKWALNPNHFIKIILKLARSKPELIKFLNLEEDLLEKLTVEEDEKATVVNTEVQTELHPIESLIDKNYTFSEWEMKRRALKLASLTRCATKSQQTVRQSCFRTEMGVQVSPFRNAATQTARDAFCNHPAVLQSVLTLLTGFPVPEIQQNTIKTVKKQS